MAQRITIIIDDDGVPAGNSNRIRLVPPRRQALYDRLAEAQVRARQARDWIDNCSCNPANGGSGICMCVNPFNQVWC